MMHENEWEYRMRLGIAKPKTAEQINVEADINGMRLAILKGSRDSALIRSCLDTARYAGLSGEDTYALLAYHALIHLEHHFQMTMERVKLDPKSPLRFMDDRDFPSTSASEGPK
jgi:hypothetical protein